MNNNIRSAILWKEMTEEEKKFYETEYKEYINKLVGWKTNPKTIEQIMMKIYYFV